MIFNTSLYKNFLPIRVRDKLRPGIFLIYEISAILFLFVVLLFVRFISCFLRVKIGVLNSFTIGHIVMNLSNLVAFTKDIRGQKEKSWIVILGARRLCNAYLLDEIKRFLPRNFIYIRLPVFFSVKLEEALFRVRNTFPFFESILILIEDEFNITGVRRLDPAQTDANYYLQSNHRPFFESFYHRTSHSKEQKIRSNKVLAKLEQDILELRSVRPGHVIGIIDRDGAFRGQYPLRDTRSDELYAVCSILKKNGHIILRLGSKRSLKLSRDYVDFDLPFSKIDHRDKSRLEIDIFQLLDSCISWNTGYQEIPLMYHVPSLMLDELYRNDKSDNCLLLPARYRDSITGADILVPEAISKFGLHFQQNALARTTLSKISTSPTTVFEAYQALMSQTGYKESTSKTLRELYLNCLIQSVQNDNGKFVGESGRGFYGNYVWDFNRVIHDLTSYEINLAESFLQANKAAITQMALRMIG